MSEGLEKRGIRLVAENGDVFFATLRKGERALDDLGAKSDKLGREMDRAFSEIKTGAQRAIGDKLTDLAFEATGAIVDFGKGAITAAGDFEAGLNRFSAIAGTSMQQAGLSVEQFDALFMKMGADTQYSAAQAADAAIELAKGGRDAKQVFGELDETLALASAGELELANAAEISAKQLAIWENTGVNAANVADLLSQAASASTVGVEDLAVGLAQVGGVAKVAGLSFEETVTAMAQLAPGFSSASDAGTSFKAFLNNLIPTTNPARDAMRELGLLTEDGASKFYDAQGAFIGMAQASDLLHGATKDLSEAERSLALETIFGSDAQRAAAIIAERGGAAYQEMSAEMKRVGGATDVAAAKNKGFNFSMEQLRGSLETLQISLGKKVLPALTDFVNILVLAVNGVVKLVDWLGSLEIAGIGLGDVFAGLVGPASGLFEMINAEAAKAAQVVATTTQVHKGLDLAMQDVTARAAELAALERQAAIATGELGAASKLTADELKALQKAQDKAIEGGIQALAEAQGSRVAFLQDYEARQRAHMETLQGLEQEYRAASTEEDRQRIAEQLAQQQEGHQQTEEQAAASYARQQAALNAALGEQLIAYVQTQLELGAISQTEAEKLTEGITAQYGVAADSMVLLFGEMKGKIDEAAQAGEQNTAAIVTGLGTIQERAAAFEVEFNRRLDLASAGLAEMKESGKITLAEYEQMLADVRTEVRTDLLTTFDKDYAISEIQKAHEQASTGGKQVGKAFTDGVTAGINANKGTVALAARGSVAEAIAAARKEGLIASPSRRTAEEVGKPLADGIALGFQQGLPGIQDAISGGLGAVDGALSGQISAMLQRLQGQLASGLQGLASMGRLQDAWDGGGIGVGANPNEPRTGGFSGRPVTGGGTVSPPPTAAQIASAGSSSSTTTIRQTYSPTYTSAPPPPAQDWATAQAVFGGA